MTSIDLLFHMVPKHTGELKRTNFSDSTLPRGHVNRVTLQLAGCHQDLGGSVWFAGFHRGGGELSGCSREIF